MERDKAALPPILWFLLGLSILRGLVFAGLTPAYQAPDEMTHAAYVEVVATQIRMPQANEPLPPIVNASLKTSGWWDEWRSTNSYAGPENLTISAAAHPPLYYAVAAPFFLLSYRVGDTVWLFVLRMLGALMVTGAVYFAWLTVRVIAPDDRFLQAGVPLFIVLLPQLGFITAAVNNDALVVLLGAVLMYGLARFIKEPGVIVPPLIIGAAIGAGLLTKASFITILPAVLICVLVVWLRPWPGLAPVAQQASIIGGLSLVLGGWWYLWNLATTGFPLRGGPLSPAGPAIAKNMFAWAANPYFMQKMAYEFWADFGWTSILISGVWYALVSAASLAALVGFVFIALRRDVRRRISRRHLLFILIGLIAVASVYFGTAQFDILTNGGAQGRYMFIAIVPLAVLVVGGLEGYVTRRTATVALTIMGLAGAMFTAVCVLFYIMPFYYG